MSRLNSRDFPPGMVWLVGAGPGDPELLTRKAERLIRSASVLFYDALVGPGVLDLAETGTRLVPVGKRSGRHSKDQASIDRMIVEAALAGERVVRLKGVTRRYSGALPKSSKPVALRRCRLRCALA